MYLSIIESYVGLELLNLSSYIQLVLYVPSVSCSQRNYVCATYRVWEMYILQYQNSIIFCKLEQNPFVPDSEAGQIPRWNNLPSELKEPMSYTKFYDSTYTYFINDFCMHFLCIFVHVAMLAIVYVFCSVCVYCVCVSVP